MDTGLTEKGLLEAIGPDCVSPDYLISKLCKKFTHDEVIEACQRAIERGTIYLNSNGYVMVYQD